MGNRMEALVRVWALIWVSIIGYFGGIVFGAVAMVFMVLDVLWQAITGRDGLDPNGRVGSAIVDFYEWVVGQSLFALVGAGDGEFCWHPWS